jgi:hypothetical protein
MDDPTESTGRTVWQATAGAAPYLGTSIGSTAATPGRTPTNKTRTGGHPPPKNQTPDGPLPKAVQQLCEHSQDPHGIREAHVGPPHPSKILPPNWPILLVLELSFGEMIPRTSVQVCPGPFKKGQILRLVCRLCHQHHQQRSPTLHKPPGREGRGRLPQEQTKRRGSRRPWGYLTTVGTGCSWMQNRGRLQRNCIANSCWHMWWSKAGAILG